jgi:Zn-dependent protease/CBS domain-containing protein
VRTPQSPGIPLLTARGIPIRLHWSIFPIFGFLAYYLATSVFQDEVRPGQRDYSWALGLATAAIFLACIVLHELGHAVVAQRNKLPVNSITLYFFGGIAEASDEPRSAGVEFRVAGAGPLVTAVLTAGSWALTLVDAIPHLIHVGLWWLAGINLALLVFNLIPGYPLDGGRIFHAIVWKLTGSVTRSTRYAVRGGQLVSLLLVGWGIYQIVSTGSLLNGLWTMMLAAFLRNAAASTGAYVMTRSVLDTVTAAQAMARDIIYVPARARVDELLQQSPVINARQAYVVVDDGPLGVISPVQLAFVPPDRRPWTVVTQIMTPWRQVIEIKPDATLMAALRTMEEGNTAYGVVRDDAGIVAGIISRDQIAIRVQSAARR